MLTKEQWIVAESGNDEIAYKEYCESTSSLTIYVLKNLLPFIVIYFIFLKWLHLLLLSKIILGFFTLIPLFLCFGIIPAIISLFSLPRNKWLKYCMFSHLINYGLYLLQVIFYVKFVLIK